MVFFVFHFISSFYQKNNSGCVKNLVILPFVYSLNSSISQSSICIYLFSIRSVEMLLE